MRLGAVPENLIELLLLGTNIPPRPLLDTHIAMLLARAVIEGARLGFFEALADAALPAEEIAVRRGTHPAATRKLLDALCAASYLSREDGRYALTPMSRKWLLPGSPHSLHHKMLWQLTEWDWIGRTGEYVRTGHPLAFHGTLSPEEWEIYQKAMLDVARLSAPEVARRTPVPKGAQDLLDIGGSHGLFSVALCRRHPKLRAVVLDLPEAIERAAPLLDREGMGERVTHRAGDALTDDLGTAAWDVVFIANLVHHFDDTTNRELARRVARALRSGGVCVIQELVRPHTPDEAGQTGALLDLYFALTSESGTWSFEEMADWQREAGLKPRKPIRLLTMPGTGQQVAVKERE
jgi:SAM-dependent methyltransferase